MIHIDMSARHSKYSGVDERYWGYTEKDSADPFRPIDVTSSPEGTGRDIVRNLEKATNCIQEAARLIEESGENVSVTISSLNSQHHGMMRDSVLISLMAVLAAHYKSRGNKELGWGHDGDGRLHLAYNTEYSMLHTTYELLMTAMELTGYEPEWLHQLVYGALPVSGSNECEYKFRIAAIVANILNVIGWEKMRDATGESGEWLDKYGTIDAKELQ